MFWLVGEATEDRICGDCESKRGFVETCVIRIGWSRKKRKAYEVGESKRRSSETG